MKVWYWKKTNKRLALFASVILLSLFVLAYVCSALAHSGSAARGGGGGSARGRKHPLAS